MLSKYKINKQLLLFSLCIVIICEPVGISFSCLDIVFKIGKILVFLYVLYLFIAKKWYQKCSHAFRVLLIYEAVLLVSTIINGVSLYYWAYYGMTFVSSMMLTEKAVSKYGLRAIKTILIIFCVFLLVNLITYYGNLSYKKNGTSYYFLGLRTRVTDTVILVALSIVIYYVNKKKDLWFYFAIILISASAITFNVSTLYIGIMIFFLFVIFYKNRTFIKLFANKLIFILLGMLIIGMLFFGIQKYFGDLFAILGKGADLNHRQYIWISAISIIHESQLNAILGHGVTELGEWAIFEARRWQAHDQYLQILLDGGYVALFLFIVVLGLSVRHSLQNRSQKKYFMIVSIFIAYIIMMITEIYSYYPQMYIFLALLNGLALNVYRSNNTTGRISEYGIDNNSNV